MKHQTGIWIDLNKAVIIKLHDKEHSTETIHSGIETKRREDGEGAAGGRFGKQDVSDEKSKEHKLQQEVKKFLKKVHDSINGTEELVVFGPANMKVELQKSLMKKPSIQEKLNHIDIQTADSMTDNQTVAWVRNYYKDK